MNKGHVLWFANEVFDMAEDQALGKEDLLKALIVVADSLLLGNSLGEEVDKYQTTLTYPNCERRVTIFSVDVTDSESKCLH